MTMTQNIDSTARPKTYSAQNPMNMVVLLSGGGRTLENIQQEINAGRLHARISLVISSSPKAFGIQRSANLGLKCVTVSRKDYSSPQAYADAIWPMIRQAGADLVCLAGFLCLLPIPDDMAQRVINIHPALLPAFGGHGMYGHHVHEAVLAAGCKISGCTVHLADNTYDTGAIIVQRSCPVYDTDTPDTLAARVFEQECIAFPEALKLFEQGRVSFDGRIARIRPVAQA